MRQFCGCGFGTRKHKKFERHQRKCKYGQAEQGDSEGQETKEKSFNELRAEAKEREIEGYGKMNKEQLMAALKE